MVFEETEKIKYQKGDYKYKLVGNSWFQTKIMGHDVGNKYVRLYPNGWLSIADGYAWDGASGPAVDTDSFMRPSLVHDALYQLMREGLLQRKYRPHADKLMRTLCKKDGMWMPRRWWTWWAVSRFGLVAMTVDRVKDFIFTSPRGEERK